MGGFLIAYLILGLFAVLLAVSGFASCEFKKVASLEAGIEANKLEAGRLLADETAKVEAEKKTNKEFSIAKQVDYEQSLKDLDGKYKRDLARLRDPGRNGGTCPQSGAGANSTAPTSAADTGFISAEATAFLYSEARRADELRTWAQSCYTFVNKEKL